MRPIPRLNEYEPDERTVRSRLRWAMVALLVAGALACFLVVSARAACVTDFRSLPAHHGWRRFHVEHGQRCWFVDAHRHAHKRSAKREIVPLPRPRPLVLVEAPTPAQRVMDGWGLFQ